MKRMSLFLIIMLILALMAACAGPAQTDAPAPTAVPAEPDTVAEDTPAPTAVPSSPQTTAEVPVVSDAVAAETSVVILPFPKVEPNQYGFPDEEQPDRRYSFADIGLDSVLGCTSGYIEEGYTPDGQTLREYKDEAGETLAVTFGYGQAGCDVLLSSGQLITTSVYGDGAYRVFLYRNNDSGIERGKIDMNALFGDSFSDVEYRSICEQFYVDSMKITILYSYVAEPDKVLKKEYEIEEIVDYMVFE